MILSDEDAGNLVARPTGMQTVGYPRQLRHASIRQSQVNPAALWQLVHPLIEEIQSAF